MPSDTSIPAKAPWISSWKFVGITAVVIGLLNLAVIPIFDRLQANIRGHLDLLLYTTFSIPCGELAITALLAGLTGRTWLSGYLRSLIIAVVWYLSFLCGVWFVEGHHFMGLVGVLAVPWAVLIAASPLIVLRQIGWRLADRAAPRVQPRPFRIADLLQGTAVIAAALTLVRATAVVTEVKAAEYWPQVLIASGVGFLICLFLLPQATRLAFSGLSLAKTIIGFGGLATALYLIVTFTVQCFFRWDASWQIRKLALLPIAMIVGPTSAVLFTFVVLYSRTGMVLVRERNRGGKLAAQGGEPNATARLPPEPVNTGGR